MSEFIDIMRDESMKIMGVSDTLTLIATANLILGNDKMSIELNEMCSQLDKSIKLMNDAQNSRISDGNRIIGDVLSLAIKGTPP